MEVEAGSVCLLTAPGAHRLVLVTSWGDGLAQVCLLTNELELAGGRDRLLSEQASGLPYALLAELDLQGPCWISDLEPLQAIDLELLAAEPSGMPLVSRQDGRWQWKLQELAELHRLCGPCLRELLD
jgi:hypothetical protein